MYYQFEYEKQGAATFLVYRQKSQDVIDTMTMGMVSNNKIEGILPFMNVVIDDETFIKYNVSSLSTLKQYFASVVNKKRFLTVLKSLLDCLILSEEYMLESSAIVLDPEYIFVNTSTSQASVIVLPIVCENDNSTEMFFRNLLFATKFDQTEDCSYIAALISFLNSNQFFSIHAFREMVQELLNAPLNPMVGKEAQKQASKATTREQQSTNISKGTDVPVQGSVMQNASHNEETVFVQRQHPVGSSQKQEELTQSSLTAEVPTEKKQKEKKSLFRRKEKVEKKVKKDMPEPPPFDGTAGSMSASVPQEKSAKPKKEKKSLFGSKEKDNKKAGAAKRIGTMAIPGVEAAGNISQSQMIAQPVSTIEQSGKKQGHLVTEQATITNQTVIPQQQIVIEKHTIQQQNFGETTVLTAGKCDDTTVLTVGPAQTMVRMPYLIRFKNNEKIPVNKPVFRIGKERSYVDYFIGDNTAISRSHANIVTKEGQYFIVDTNSTNHVYVNGQMIPSNQEVLLGDGDKIRLANEDFTFQLM